MRDTVGKLTLLLLAERDMKPEQLWKPDFCCWYTMVVRCTSAQILVIDQELKALGVETFNRMPKGAWPARLPLRVEK